MRALVTGGSGFMGSNLVPFLEKKGNDVFVLGRRSFDTDNYHCCDILDYKKLNKVVWQMKPEIIYHLAAETSLDSGVDKFFRINIQGTRNILAAAKNVGSKVFLSGSSWQYGFHNEIINENSQFNPINYFGVSKASCDHLGYVYSHMFKMDVIRARIFNVIGPNRESDVCSDFAKRIVEVELGIRNKLIVGNLGQKRDFTDIQDAIEAIWILTENGGSEAYNVCSGVSYSMEDVLNMMLELSGTDVEVERNESSGALAFLGDNSKISALGWKSNVSIKESLSMILESWRKRLKK